MRARIMVSLCTKIKMVRWFLWICLKTSIMLHCMLHVVCFLCFSDSKFRGNKTWHWHFLINIFKKFVLVCSDLSKFSQIRIIFLGDTFIPTCNFFRKTSVAKASSYGRKDTLISIWQKSLDIAFVKLLLKIAIQNGITLEGNWCRFQLKLKKKTKKGRKRAVFQPVGKSVLFFSLL